MISEVTQDISHNIVVDLEINEDADNKIVEQYQEERKTIHYTYNPNSLTNLNTNNPVLKMLKEIHTNCMNYSSYHNTRYMYYKKIIFFVFRIPIILLAAINSFLAIGVDSYIDQKIISITNAIVSLVCGIFTSIELFLNLQKRIEMDFISYKEYYILGVDAYELIQLHDYTNVDHEKKKIIDGQFAALYVRYKELVYKSNPINYNKIEFHDALTVNKNSEIQQIDNIEV